MPGDLAISAQKMRDILEVSRVLAVTADLDQLLQYIAKSTTALLQAERASFFLHDTARRQLWTRVALGADEIRVPDDAGIVGRVFTAKTLLNIPDAYADPRFNRGVDRKTGFVTRNLLTAPMFDTLGQPIGVIQAINKNGGPFTAEDEQTIELLAAQGGVAVQRYHLQAQAIQAGELRREMDLAKGVQESVLPAQPPQVPGLAAVGWTRPASITGGDCYDLWTIDDARMGIFLGDASGHGLAPALEVLQARTLARALSDINCDPGWILTHVNARLARDLRLGHFITVFLGCMNQTGELVWASAGHGPVLYRSSPDAQVKILEPGAPPIGIVDVLTIEPAQAVKLDPGGMLMLMSDGIFEAMSPERDLFGVERVIQILDSHRNQPPQALLELLQKEVRSWQQKEDPNDDQTIVIVQRT